jgi:sigma-B regulation protein RsbU (phosphoserine phosphatase)
MSPLSGNDPDMLRRVASEIRKKMDLEASLNVAQKRQRFMLPPPPELPGYEFASTYDPASEISGDFYDFIPLGEGRVGVLQADVSGHGVEAAIVMGMAKKALSIFARSSSGPKETLVYGNDDLCADLDAETFLTVVYADLDANRHRMVLARAGHSLPVMFNRKRKPSHQMLKSGGMMLGMYPGPTFARALSEITVDIVAGDLVFVYTDGLVEAHSPSGEQYGMERVLAVIEHRAKERPEKILEALRESLADFRRGREPEDDVTMIAFRRTR